MKESLFVVVREVPHVVKHTFLARAEDSIDAESNVQTFCEGAWSIDAGKKKDVVLVNSELLQTGESPAYIVETEVRPTTPLPEDAELSKSVAEEQVSFATLLAIARDLASGNHDRVRKATEDAVAAVHKINHYANQAAAAKAELVGCQEPKPDSLRRPRMR